MNNNNSSDNMLLSFIMGLVAGAGIVFLSDDKKRNKLKMKMDEMRRAMMDKKDDITKTGDKPPLDL